MSTVRTGGQEEIRHVPGQEGWSSGGMSCPTSGAAPERRYATSKVSSSAREQKPHVQGKEQDGALVEQP